MLYVLLLCLPLCSEDYQAAVLGPGPLCPDTLQALRDCWELRSWLEALHHILGGADSSAFVLRNPESSCLGTRFPLSLSLFSGYLMIQELILYNHRVCIELRRNVQFWALQTQQYKSLLQYSLTL